MLLTVSHKTDMRALCLPKQDKFSHLYRKTNYADKDKAFLTLNKFNQPAHQGRLMDNSEQHREITARVLAILKSLRFGSIEIVVHDGRVVQIDKHEKYRLNTPCTATDFPPDIRR